LIYSAALNWLANEFAYEVLVLSGGIDVIQTRVVLTKVPVVLIDDYLNLLLLRFGVTALANRLVWN
jgi:hypothetical protein